jgi:murein DD-endopeptidase MepM/ murein hydrolase activator NlpD
VLRKAFTVVLALGLAGYFLLPLPGQGASRGQLDRRADILKAKIQKKKQREGVLTTDISRYNNRIRALQGRIRGLQDRQNRIQATLDDKKQELQEIRDDLEKARSELVDLREMLTIAEETLSERLVQMYKDGDPDALTVILEADGFADLLERAEFLGRLTDQNNRIIARVRTLKARWTTQAKKLKSLEGSAVKAANAIAARRNEVAAVKGKLVGSRVEIQGARNGRAALLARTRENRHRLEGDLAAVQAQVRRQLQAAQPNAFAPTSGGGGPIRRGSGQLIWPVNGPVVSGFGMRWGRLHAGIDIAAPGGTPIRAADSGQVVIAGWVGGYGNYVCVQHTGSLSTCYAHQPGIQVSVGQGVSQGQVIGAVGCTGHCFGDHLHFETRVNGSPVDPMGYL